MGKKYYGSETEKAIQNFPFNIYRFHSGFVRALAQIKKATAVANFEAGNFSADIKNAIVKACDEILAGKHKDQFPLPGFMGGAGTSIHMNMNEVVAGRATEILREEKKNIVVHPNDHVNRSQSTNDVNPTAIKVASADLLDNLKNVLDNLVKALEKKEKDFAKVPKLGRTHLQDAVPVTLGEEFGAYANIIKRHAGEIKRVKNLALTLHLGGTAAGNSVNASPKYISSVYKELKKITGQNFRPAQNFMAHTSSASDFLEISQAVTSLCMDCSKIASDLRLMSSGPRGGFGEISLEELQKGSSIMPGKVNPVMLETVNVLYYMVSGNNLTIEQSAHGAQLELAVMIPPIADRLLLSLKITAEVLAVFTNKCVVSIKANKERCLELLEKSTAYATLLTPRLGYETVSNAVKETISTGKTLREVIVGKNLLTDKEFNKIVNSFKI